VYIAHVVCPEHLVPISGSKGTLRDCDAERINTQTLSPHCIVAMRIKAASISKHITLRTSAGQHPHIPGEDGSRDCNVQGDSRTGRHDSTRENRTTPNPSRHTHTHVTKQTHLTKPGSPPHHPSTKPPLSISPGGRGPFNIPAPSGRN